MKLWMKTAIGIIIGILIALFIPFGDTTTELIQSFSEIAINIGRYVVFPLVFFSLAISICKLRRENKLFKTTLFTIIYLVGSTLILVVLGVIITLIISPPIIPLSVETQTIFDFSTEKNSLLLLFPKNLFTVFVGKSNVLLPLYFLSFIIGFTLYKDREISEPTFNLFDSLSRIFFEINIFITKITPILLAVLSFNLIKNLTNITDFLMFKDLIVILSISSIVILIVIYPFILYLSDKKKNPYKTLSAMIAPVLTGAISGDTFFSLSILTRSGKEDLGISRKISALTYPLCAMFGKAGTALVTSVSFLTIIKSYTSLEITPYQILWVILFSILISFALASIPSIGVYTALYLLSTTYSQLHSTHTDSYLLIKPIIPILIGFSVMIDLATSALISVLVSRATSKCKS